MNLLSTNNLIKFNSETYEKYLHVIIFIPIYLMANVIINIAVLIIANARKILLTGNRSRV